MTQLRVLLMAFLLAVVTALPAGAQDPTSPVPGGCDMPRRSVTAIIESAGSNPESNPIPGPIPYVAPVGMASDAETSQRVRILVDGFVECVNRGDIVGFLSLLSDGFLRRHFGSFGFTSVELTAFELERMEMDNRVVVVEIRDIIVLRDGRVSVLVMLEQGGDASPELTSRLTLVERDGTLVIDAWQPVTLESDANAWQSVSGDGYQGAIVPAEQAADYVRWLNGATTQGAWMPTSEQIAALEVGLPGFLRTRSSVSSDLDDRLPEYQRHYIGYVLAGHAYILVNAFCQAPVPNGAPQPVIVMDGGDCFFYAVWDPAAGEFADFRVNGEA